MICVDQETGHRSKEPLQTLLRIRGSKVNCINSNYPLTLFSYTYRLILAFTFSFNNLLTVYIYIIEMNLMSKINYNIYYYIKFIFYIIVKSYHKNTN